MRVGVVSAPNKQAGKTTLASLLTNVFPHAVGKEAIYVTNGDLNEILGTMKFNEKSTSIEKSITVLNSLSKVGDLSKEEVLDYAYRPIETNGMFFDLYQSNIQLETAFAQFMNIVEKFGNRFIIMDINGDPRSKNVVPFIDECDVVLYLFRPNKFAAKEAKDYYESLDEHGKAKTKFVCNIWNSSGVSKKTVQDLMKFRKNSILWLPYNPQIERAGFENRLCVINREMLKGRAACLDIRQGLKDVLSYCCDTKTHKVVKEVAEWQL